MLRQQQAPGRLPHLDQTTALGSDGPPPSNQEESHTGSQAQSGTGRLGIYFDRFGGPNHDLA